MPRARKLKVYRTPIGFHDAYVAAPSQKAALEAWGSDANLFARGIAEQVTDPQLIKEPLAQPGKIVRKLRGTAEEQAAAKEKKRKRATPRPSRAALDAAEQARTDAEVRHTAAIRELDRRAAALARERGQIEKRQAAEMKKLDATAARARKNYETAIARWRG